MGMIQQGWVAVRKDAYGGREWFDMSTWAGGVRIALAKSQYGDKHTSGLKVASPMVRIQKVECRALEDRTPKIIDIIGPDGRALENKEVPE